MCSACGARATGKLSEASHTIAYPAGLGSDRSGIVRLNLRRPNAERRCLATAAKIESSRRASAALVVRAAVVRERPQARSAVVARLARLDENHLPTVLGVIGLRRSAACVTTWYRVELSVLPNETTGWVPAHAVATYRVSSRIVVDLSQRRLRLYRLGKLTLNVPVAVGAPQTPTPAGRFFVNERYVLPDASGPFGPAALGISAHSTVLEHVWTQNGPIAIHGTNEPASIGDAASHGCIHVANAVMRRLIALVPAGTPVLVQA